MKHARSIHRFPRLQVKTIRPRKGDVLIISTEKSLSQEEAYQIGKEMKLAGFEKILFCPAMNQTIRRGR